LISHLQDAIHFFAAMPSDVVDAWLVERVESRVWPPVGPAWHALLRFYTPEQWQAFSWEKREVDLLKLDYSDKSLDIITGLAAARFQNIRNSYSSIENSDARMRSIYDYLEQTGRLPGSVVLIKGGSWEIVDGSHRIACYVAFRNTPHLSGRLDPLQSAWVATPGKV
jgi:hypothetical protein